MTDFSQNTGNRKAVVVYCAYHLEKENNKWN
jgi:hypothetical protein